MTIDTGVVRVDGNDWAGTPDESVETDARGWPVLHAADPCDGRNPMTGRSCGHGYHQGHHRDSTGAEWLDEE